MQKLNRVYIFVGPEKTGTSWIYQFLLDNNVKGVAKGIKEINFFNHDNQDLKSFLSNFSEDDHLIDVSPTYFQNNVAMQNIKKFVKNPKIIITLRDPVERTISFFRFMRTQYDSDLSFENFKKRYKRSLIKYTENIDKWIKEFGKENVDILIYEKIFNPQSKELNRINNLFDIDISPNQIKYHLKRKVYESSGIPKNRKIFTILRYVAFIFYFIKLGRVIRFLYALGFNKKLFLKKDKIETDCYKSDLLDYFKDDVILLKQKYDLDCSAWQNFK